jgi:isopenicillin N synthase-like dioxygenase
MMPGGRGAGERAGDPFWVMRIIHYPPLQSAEPEAAAAAAGGSEVERSTQLSCGEHTDYGLLTMVNQDEGISALQVRESLQCTHSPSFRLLSSHATGIPS